jgi:uncharacterized membrane protein YeaQ/YmgE (transglycosylase-associated protein family)
MPLTLVGLVLLGLLVLAILVSVSFWLTFGLIGLALHVLMAGLIGWLADLVVPGTLPWGWFGAILAGLVGSWIGVRLIGHFGPALFGVPIIPGFVGALILAFALSLIARRGRGSLGSV